MVVSNSKLAKVVAPALDKVVKNAAWRKHGKLVQHCKVVLDEFARPGALSPAAPPATPRDASTNGDEIPPENGDAAVTEPVGVFDSPLYDDNMRYSLADAELIILPLCEACETLSPKVVEPALDCFQKLVAHGHLRGEMDTGGSDSGGGKLLLQVMDSVCNCHGLRDGDIELLVLKTLLSAVTSAALRVHGDCLLKAVRTCYNVFHGSKSPVNQTTAQASLAQMLVIVFRRMEADSSTVPVQPIVVADLMEPATEQSSSDASVTQFVQGFITKVVQDVAVVFSTVPPLKTNKHDEAFDAAASEISIPTYMLESTDKDMRDAKYGELDPDGDKEADLDVQITNKLRQDAFFVFRALCEQSMKNPPQEGNINPFSLRGKILALELLKILLENAGAVFCTSDRFLGAIKQYLFLSLLENTASSMMNVFQLSCSIFMSLLSRFRAGLKIEIGVFFSVVVLRVLENGARPNYWQKTIVLRILEQLCVDPQILVDIFVNYDCDVDSSNICERMVIGLLKTAQGVPTGAEASLHPQQDAALKLAAIKCLVKVLRSMGDWSNRPLSLTDFPYLKTADKDDTTRESSGGVSSPAHEGGEENAQTEEGEGSSETEAEPSEAAFFEQRRAYKLEFQEGIALFNKKPREGIAFLIKSEKLGSSPEDIATFLKTAPGLDKTMIGNYLGEREDLSLKVMHSYVDFFNFEENDFDEAIRTFLLDFRLPGEAQKIGRLMGKFASRYCKCNPKSFTSADTAFVLAYSVIMLNTNAHNPMVKSKMSKADFIRNNRGIDDGKNLPEEFLNRLYDRIVSNEIKMKADAFVLSKQPTNVNRFPGLDHILNIVFRKPREFSFVQEPRDDVIRHIQEQLKAKAGKPESVYYSATDVKLLRPMVDVIWAPMLAAFSVPLVQSEDEVMTFQCLEGFRQAIYITSVLTMSTQRNAFITSLEKIASLHSIANTKQKIVDAIKAIISHAEEDGSYLQEAQEYILINVQKLEYLHLIDEDAPPDATFFAALPSEAEKRQLIKRPVLPVLRRTVGGSRWQNAGVEGVTAIERVDILVTNCRICSFETKFPYHFDVGLLEWELLEWQDEWDADPTITQMVFTTNYSRLSLIASWISAFSRELHPLPFFPKITPPLGIVRKLHPFCLQDHPH